MPTHANEIELNFSILFFCFVLFFLLLENSYSDESPLIPNEFLNEPHITSHNLGGDPILGVMIENEPDQWSSSVPNNVVRALKDKQVNQVIQCDLFRFRLNCSMCILFVTFLFEG